MLYRYQKSYEKIVLGILSLSNNSENVKYIKQEIAWYGDSKQRNLFLWNDQFNNWAGLIGIEKFDDCVVVRRIVLTPDADTVFNIFHILDNIKEMYPNVKIMGTLKTQEYINKWEQNIEQRKN